MLQHCLQYNTNQISHTCGTDKKNNWNRSRSSNFDYQVFGAPGGILYWFFTGVDSLQANIHGLDNCLVSRIPRVLNQKTASVRPRRDYQVTFVGYPGELSPIRHSAQHASPGGIYLRRGESLPRNVKSEAVGNVR